MWVQVWVWVRLGLRAKAMPTHGGTVAAVVAAVVGAAYTSTRDEHIGQYVHMAHARAGQACVQGWKRTVNVDESS